MSVPLLGFGTASVLGSHGRRDSERAIRAALDAGIRTFDTARSYGWGEAEAVLGKMVRAIPREDLVIISKCGLVPVRQSALLRLAKAVARQIITVLPALRGQVQRVASSQAVQPVRTYDLETLKGSLRDSLANLDMSYLDVLLLHNFEAGKPGLEPVVAWMRELKAQGIVRDYGFSIESGVMEGLDWLASENLLDGAVIQTPVDEALLHLPDRYRSVEFIVHSPFRYLRQRAEVQHGYAFGDVVTDVRKAIRCRAVVCSMFSESHQQHNIAAVTAALANG